MKIQVLPLLAVLLCPVASACEPSISGEWQSDGERTMAFARNRTKLEPRQESFLAALMGHMTMEFSEGQLRLRFPDLKVPVKGELKPFAGFEIEQPYKILFCNDRMTVVQSTRSDGADDVTTYYFVGPDEMWAYTGGDDPAIPDMHLREYFRRLR
jgi:hypothetical protein